MCATGTCDDCLRNVAVLSGLNGRNGIDGNRIQIGTGDPDPAAFNDDDFYIDRNPPLNFYHKEAGAWVFIGRLQGLDGNGFFYSESTLVPAADILNSQATPVVISQTPPAGYAIIPISVVFSIHYNSVPYVAPYGLAVVYNNGPSSYVAGAISSFIQSIQSTMLVAAISSQIIYVPGVPLAIKPTSPGTITAGNSPILVRVIYYITPA